MKVSGVGLLWGSLGRAVGASPPGWGLSVALIPEAAPQGVVNGQTAPTNPHLAKPGGSCDTVLRFLFLQATAGEIPFQEHPGPSFSASPRPVGT